MRSQSGLPSVPMSEEPSERFKVRTSRPYKEEKHLKISPLQLYSARLVPFPFALVISNALARMAHHGDCNNTGDCTVQHGTVM